MKKFTPMTKSENNLPRVLILEDSEQRIKLFKEFLGGKCRLHIYKTAWSAITNIQNLKYDLILLDHDLGGRVYVTEDSENGTGYDVAKAIPNTINKTTLVVVHSFNPTGVHNILNVLPNAKYIPFGEQLFKSIKFPELTNTETPGT